MLNEFDEALYAMVAPVFIFLTKSQSIFGQNLGNHKGVRTF